MAREKLSPVDHTQEVVENIVESGIKAIWNLSFSMMM